MGRIRAAYNTVERDRRGSEPIYKRMHADLLASGHVQADETPVKCIDPDEMRAGMTQGYVWFLSRPGGDVVFDCRMSRRHAN